jgi:hypothetical protein
VQWYAEYRYRRRFGGSHDEYLDTPGEAVAWLNSIDGVVEEIDAKRERERRARNG